MNIVGASLSNDPTGLNSGKSKDVNSERNMLVMKQAQNIAKEQGQALVELVNQASKIISPNGGVDIYV
jgi:protein-disulfide isomerase-like protein with CxxC motif